MKEIYPQGSVCLAPSASTFPLLHVEASNKSIQPRFNLSDGRTGSQVLRPSRKQMESVNNRTNKEQLNPPRCGENTILMLRARRFSTLLNAPRCGVRSILAGQLTF